VKNTIPAKSGIRPSTRIRPGELEKPIVRNSSPGSDCVCSSGRNLTPIYKFMPIYDMMRP
jgi:hypothetical protein